ncbi:MAG: 5-(carboxyamino)imidazole ribonucleotide synthase [Actinomycetota bacterium]|jgi:5-(carboxyamino)imidazole ribonucleotide synthase|nr:5-(carboxyamino)imidazole ribonucleotide synthase [Actinomycetota bacterium]MDA2985969.1 5-(carboxyamino)imidazole ribonucleotide synthase [Actinomycetota bacterium]
MQTVGVIGGGQLARMMQPAAIALGINLAVFAESEGSSAHGAVTKVGDYTDLAQLREFAKDVDVITFDHEHVPTELLRQLEAEGVNVRPGPAALIHAQNKLVMRKKLAELGLPQPNWAEITSPQELEQFIGIHGPKIVVKTPIGGYDGKGVRVVSSAAEVSDWLENLESFGGSLLAEQKVDFLSEAAQLIARRPSGEAKTWPLVQTIQSGGVCSEVIAPYPSLSLSDPAADIAHSIANGLGVTGVMAVEMFVLADGSLLVNELAMRPHNSGHFSIEGSNTSQFEQHLRAVLDLPLGDTGMRGGFAVMVNLLGVDDKNSFYEHYPTAMARYPSVSFHLYQKTARLGRKMGHLTVLGSNHEELLETGREARSLIYGEA